MVVPVNIGLLDPLPKGFIKWLINEGDPNHLVTRMILQVPLFSKLSENFVRHVVLTDKNWLNNRMVEIGKNNSSHLHTCREWYYCILSLPSAWQDEQKTSKSGIKDCAGINSSFLDVKLTRTTRPKQCKKKRQRQHQESPQTPSSK